MIKKIGKKSIATAIIAGILFAMAVGSAKALSQGEESVPIELSAHVDRVVANPGDVITFTLSADYRDDIHLDLPEVADKLSDFRIADSGMTGPVQEDNRMIAERWYKLQAEMSGSYIIDPVEVIYLLPEGKEAVAKTPKIFVEIKSLLVEEGETGDIRDIKPPLPAPPSYRIFLIAAALSAAAILLIFVVRKLVELYKSRAETKHLAPRPAHEEAIEALERLLAKKLIEQGRAREFCFEISEIFRRYMEARFRIPAIDMTTEEIIPRVEKNGIIKEQLRPLIRDFLTSTDLVKFARYRPSRKEIDQIIDHTRSFIDKTMITLAPNAPGGERP